MMVALLTPEGILQAAFKALKAELQPLLKEKKTLDMTSRRPRDQKIADITVGMCILEHAAEILIRPEDFND